MSRGPEDLVRAARAWIVDMDGTIYVDEALLPGAREFLAALDRRGAPYLFCSNNSSRRARDYEERLARLGIPPPPGRVLTSGDATIEHLVAETPHRSVCLIGTPALEEEFRAAGLDLEAADPDCVVAAFDTTLTYAKLERATALLFRGKPYYATHPDKTCITRHGLVPDVAAVIGALEAVTGRTPTIVGKPSPIMARAALRRLGVLAAEAAIVGDQLDTDMTMAHDAGLLGVCVLSGETSRAKLDAWPARPPVVVDGVATLAAWLG